ncbi:MAG: LamG-like jellyroll fold domain-containing protein, partial [Nanoarchaeota archaeon]|nr:LamG-like jellyroll fold domain-containing protein [Nanoarchaeota archaeon]
MKKENEKKDHIINKKKKRSKAFIIGILLFLLLIVLAVRVYSQSSEDLQSELNLLESELSNQGYSWLVNYSVDYNSINESSASISVFRQDSNEEITRFENITSENWHKIYLTNLSENESRDVFDLRVANNPVEFDYIVDPTKGVEIINHSNAFVLHDPDNVKSDSFGFSVATGDFNGDGYDDALIGAYLANSANADVGKAFIYYGNASGIFLSKHSPDVILLDPDNVASDYFGRSVATGDFNNDSYDDALVGAYVANSANADVGKAFIYYGAGTNMANGTNANITLIDPDNVANDYFGYSVATGDFNRDGYDDALVGAYATDFANADLGKAFIYFFGNSFYDYFPKIATNGTTSSNFDIYTYFNSTCRYSTTSGTSYEAMTNFNTSDGINHSASISGLLDRDVKSYYVRCINNIQKYNTSEFLVTLTVAENLNTYDINNSLQWACQKTETGAVPTNPDNCTTTASAANYASLKSSDGNEWTVNGSNTTNLYESQIFVFNISNVSTRAKFYWEGQDTISTSGYGVSLFIWNYNKSRWDIKDAKDFPTASDDSLIMEINEMGDYINLSSGQVAFLAAHKHYKPSSCPYIFSFNGSDYEFDSEAITLYSIFKEFEGKQPSKLNYLRQNGSEYNIEIRELVAEKSNIDSVELLKISHPKGIEIYPALDHPKELRNFFGLTYPMKFIYLIRYLHNWLSDYTSFINPSIDYHFESIENPQKPISALENNQSVYSIMEEDNIFWNSGLNNLSYSEIETLNKSLYHSVELVYEKPNNAKKAKLLLGYKEDKFVSWIGSRIGKSLNETGLDDDGTKLYKRELEDFALVIELWDGKKWVYGGNLLDYPSEPSKMAVPLDIKNIKGDKLKIRIKGYPKTMLLDFAYIDYSKDFKLKIIKIPLKEAEKGDEDVKKILQHSESKRITLDGNKQESVNLVFDDGKNYENETNSLFLNVRGYYEPYQFDLNVLRNKSYVKELLDKPGKIIREILPIYLKENFPNTTDYENEKSNSLLTDYVYLASTTTVTVSPMPRVYLINPLDNHYILNSTQTFDFIANYTEDAGLMNSTLYIWNSTNVLINQTSETKTGIFNNSNISVALPGGNNFQWNYYACDNSSNCAWGSKNFSILFDSSPPIINFTSPTPANATSTVNTSIIVNMTISELNLNELKYNWNGTNYTIYNDSLVLMMNMNNRSALGENSTYAVDVSKYGNNGTATGATFNSTGKYGGGYSFDGNDYVNVSDSNSLDVTTSMTVGAWVYLNKNATSGYPSIVVKPDSNDWDANPDYADYDLRVFTDAPNIGKFEFFLNDYANTRTYSTTITEAGVWYHIVATYNNSDIEIYVNGIKENNRTVGSGKSRASTVQLGIGARAPPSAISEYWNGTIDEVRIWNRPLTATEVYELYVSNLQKSNSSLWYLYVNQGKNASAELDFGNYTYSVSAKDVNGNENKTDVRTLSITSDIIPPNTALISPANGTTVYTAAQIFAASFSDNGKLVNTTLYIWNSTGSLINSSENRSISGTSNVSNISIILPRDDNYTWNYYTCDNSTNCAWNNTNFSLNYISCTIANWVGATSTNWSTASNWDINFVPNETNCVILNASASKQPVLEVPTLIYNLTINGTLNLTMNWNASLNVSGDVAILSGGKLIHGDNSNAEVWRVNMQVGRNLTINSGGSISVTGLGYRGATSSGPGNGPGRGGQSGGDGGGSGYGGAGGRGGSSASGGITYGTSASPTALGSGGALYGAASTAGDGGGAIKLSVSGTLTVNGNISADGTDAVYSSGYNGGAGGSGGSIWITGRPTIVGTGIISANGGDGDCYSGYFHGGGGGGRIDISNVTVAGSTFLTGGGTLSVGRGLADGDRGEDGSAGTIKFPDNFDLVIDNSGASGLRNLTLGVDANNQTVFENLYNFLSITVKANSTLSLSGNPQIVNGGNASNPYGQGVTISATNINIQVNGSISADGYGFSAGYGGNGYGPGAGLYAGDGKSTGAGHGGAGGNTDNGAGGSTFGTVISPTALGSGGGSYYVQTPSDGGGAIKLSVSGTLTVNGTISADAIDAVRTSGYVSGGGGAGGSIYFNVTTLAGSGKISADGGNADSYGGYSAGGGGGGRIYIYSNSINFTGNLSSLNGAGAIGANPGQNGTILIELYDTINLSQITFKSPFDVSKYNSTFGLVAYENRTLNNSLDFAGMINYISIYNQSIVVNTSSYDYLKSQAQIWFYQVPYKNPWLLKDGSFCDGVICSKISDQDISDDNNTAKFRVTGFTNYTITNTSAGICDNGNLSTTCYVTQVHGVTDGQNINGIGNLVIQNGGSLYNSSTNCSGTNHGCSLVINMTGNLTIESGGNITVGNISITAANVNVSIGGLISLNGLGYYSSKGTGNGTPGDAYDGGAGAGYGGTGGNGETGYAGGSSYGSYLEPIDLGSGGGLSSSYAGGAGGGA